MTVYGTMLLMVLAGGVLMADYRAGIQLYGLALSA